MHDIKYIQTIWCMWHGKIPWGMENIFYTVFSFSFLTLISNEKQPNNIIIR